MKKRSVGSWALFQASFRALRENKKLLVFPMISGLCVLLIVGSFLLPIVAAFAFHGPEEGMPLGSLLEIDPDTGGLGLTSLAYLALLGFYFVGFGLTVFFNTALTRAAISTLRHEPSSVGGSLRFALGRWRPILAYTLIACTVGVVLRLIQERLGILGRIGIGLVGIVWSLVTYMVVPVLVCEDRGGWDSVKRSASIFKQTWGETVLGRVGLGAIGVVIALVIIIAVAALVVPVVLSEGSIETSLWALGVGVALLFLSAILMSILLQTLNAIYAAALYLFATEGTVPDSFRDPRLGRLWVKPTKGP